MSGPQEPEPVPATSSAPRPTADDDVAAPVVVTPAAVATPASSSSASSSAAATVVAAEPAPRISFSSYYLRYATAFDVLMMLTGTIGGLVTGALIPTFQWLFGRMMDSLNSGANMTEAVSDVAIIFAYMSVVAFVFGHLQVWAWSVYGERQVARIRGLYVAVRA